MSFMCPAGGVFPSANIHAYISLTEHTLMITDRQTDGGVQGVRSRSHMETWSIEPSTSVVMAVVTRKRGVDRC